MNNIKLAWKNLTNKPLNMMLSLVLFALGVGMISMIFLIENQVQEKFDSRLPVNKLILLITKDEIDFSNGSPCTPDLLIANENLKTTDILDPIVD